MKLQPIFNIIHICAIKGVKHAILSPGSRCAPLTIGFNRHPDIECKVISDERSAAFIGLGMAQQLKAPVALACTSGSAAFNYAPGVAEAYYQQIPLILLTADRPSEWIDQKDGQTIRQNNIYGSHVKKSFQIPDDLSHEDAEWYAYRMISEAINLSMAFPKGPVHVNFPFREPFYPDENTEVIFEDTIKIIKEMKSADSLSEMDHFEETWNKSNKKLIIGGQESKNQELSTILGIISKEHRVPVIGDIISNQHGIPEVIAHSDLFLADDKKGLWKSLAPDLVITYGKSTISKNLKLFLRKHKPLQHWHIQENGQVADTYQALTHVVRSTPEAFLDAMQKLETDDAFNHQKQENYYHIWEIEERKSRRTIKDFFTSKTELSEPLLVHEVLTQLLQPSNLHLANSMSVRYANFIGLDQSQVNIEVFANRGTSGIDGCTSAAVGASLISDKLNFLITGDMAFFYDRNAFWHNYDISNLRIIVLNNHGGGIFGMIKGPKQQAEYKEFFKTEQNLSARWIAEEYGFEYLKCDRKSKIKNYVSRLCEPSDKTIILELETSSENNEITMAELKKKIKDAK